MSSCPQNSHLLPSLFHFDRACVYDLALFLKNTCYHSWRKQVGEWFAELWCWRRLLRVPWTARKSNQSILKEVSPEYSLQGLILKLKLLYFGHLMRTADFLEKTLMLRKIEGRRRRGWQRMRWLDGITESMVIKTIEFEQALGVGDGQGSLASCSPWGSKDLDRTEWLNWTEHGYYCFCNHQNPVFVPSQVL